MDIYGINQRYLIVLIAFFVSCHAVAGDSIRDTITIERTHTELDTDLSGGKLVMIDCTFALKNSGDDDGVATLIIETDAGKILEKLDVYVPRKSINEMNMKVDISFLDAMAFENTKYRISGQRNANIQDAIDWKSLIDKLHITINV